MYIILYYIKLKMDLEFEKEENGNWYVVLPDWEGTKEDLQMVLGADDMLDIVAKGDKKVTLKIELDEFEESTHIELMKECSENVGGGDYILKTWKDKELNLEMWLCSVCIFVFGYMPENIYFSRLFVMKEYQEWLKQFIKVSGHGWGVGFFVTLHTGNTFYIGTDDYKDWYDKKLTEYKNLYL